MQVGFGEAVPRGHLLVYSTDTEEEAKKLIVTTCWMGYDGKYYAPELVEEQTIDNLIKFSDRLELVDRWIKERAKQRAGSATERL